MQHHGPRIWLNLELAKKPAPCLEYIVVHELAHLLERHHSDRFTALMDRFMPQWRLYRDELNRAPLGHEAWGASSPAMHSPRCSRTPISASPWMGRGVGGTTS
ncbi:M48 metallopeptidase family protein [Geobacter metallireducens]|uniref:M48 metallopeptidase family protein n=1 Tax=Geobacter metallireducens TaxID=28232 RepID=UPI001930BE12